MMGRFLRVALLGPLRMEEEKDRLINATDKVSKPELSRGVDWRMRLLDLERDAELKLDAAAIS